MIEIPLRYTTIRDFIDSLHTANVLTEDSGSISFLHSDDYWYSHISFKSEHSKRERFFNVMYMKNVDDVIVSSNFFNLVMNSNFNKWLENTLCYDLQVRGFKVHKEIKLIATREGYSHVIRVKIKKEHNFKEVYEIYKLFNHYEQILQREAKNI